MENIMTSETECVNDCDKIENFSVFNSPTVAITLLKHECVDNGVMYNVCLDYILSDDPLQVISTTTDLYSNYPLELIVEASALGSIYNNLLDIVRVIDLETGKEVSDEVYSLDEVLEDWEL
jgi:hypothetical protein